MRVLVEVESVLDTVIVGLGFAVAVLLWLGFVWWVFLRVARSAESTARAWWGVLVVAVWTAGLVGFSALAVTVW